MAQKNSLVNGVLWLVGILVALAVGFGMTSKLLVVPYIPEVVTIIAGWIIVVGTVIGAVLVIIDFFK